MNPTRRPLALGMYGSRWGWNYPAMVVGILGTGQCQTSIPPREGCG